MSVCQGAVEVGVGFERICFWGELSGGLVGWEGLRMSAKLAAEIVVALVELYVLAVNDDVGRFWYSCSVESLGADQGLRIANMLLLDGLFRSHFH